MTRRLHPSGNVSGEPRSHGADGLGRGLGLAAGVLADRLLHDPPDAGHPVAWFGRWAGWLEQRMWADTVSRGAAYCLIACAPAAAAGLGLEAAGRRSTLARMVTTGVTTWVVLGAGSLAREGRTMADRLASGDLDGAREQLPHLCGRLAAGLDEPELARATVESMAENTADSAVASLFWGAVGGLPAMLVHRAVNTLDAMVGHHSDRYEHFGAFSARLDDALDLVPARITGTLACVLAPAVGGDARRAARIMLRDAAHHPSPNGGWCEAAWAGALGVRLGGRNVYPGGRVEHRGLLGEGPRPDGAAVRRASRLVHLVSGAAGALAGLGALATGRAAHRTAHRRGARRRKGQS
ncbi:adenosylcobinamide-phosphate synthase CbiB [Propionibacterium australiense]|uniref:Cobalamin biosynthesis protein CobD n=1 Tax=Propionibacterium australiense TaxID=119981 RepID=A0A383SA80_9ACTN|nr:adenosylcobinamide-phosphate synthase CbiB [Propionibacterium australiense]RLP06865.1 cobalamin biosynthesis protein CobD [Propionibacterium australiense]RLP08865.1 cobalamin biosynthesis protein CobD [Propionibacterium australiense]SYZ34324.1 threonine-phosphate decarboxylase [Propionibacterium australiense]VEH90082.1 cobalamin biosynthesis protein [Propionibacterium australiense]